MAKAGIGFIHGAPENPNKTWERQIDGRTYVFKKTREKEGVFLYGCEHRSESNTLGTTSATSFFSDRDLMPDEIEQLPQFAAVLSGRHLTSRA
jgi:hypothetical protein